MLVVRLVLSAKCVIIIPVLIEIKFKLVLEHSCCVLLLNININIFSVYITLYYENLKYFFPSMHAWER
jgi:hypothetical protein